MRRNYGFLEAPPQGIDYLLGTIDKPILMESGQWDEFLPFYEPQSSKSPYFDTYACVTFSALNCLEVLHNYFNNEIINYSDRLTAKLSGTIPGVGNYFRSVAESIRKDGVVLEPIYPFIANKNEYYQTVPSDVRIQIFKINMGWEWIRYNDYLTDRKERLIEGLQYGPLQISVHAWPRSKNGIYPRSEKQRNHAVMLYGYEEGRYWKIFDHYKQERKKLAWDYNFGSAILYSLEGTVDLAKKYEGMLIKNVNSPDYFYSNGEQIAYIKNESSFLFGYEAGFWGYWDNVLTVKEKIKKDITF